MRGHDDPVAIDHGRRSVPAEGGLKGVTPQQPAGLALQSDGGLGGEADVLADAAGGAHHGRGIAGHIVLRPPSNGPSRRIQRNHACLVGGTGAGDHLVSVDQRRAVVAMAACPDCGAFFTYEHRAEIRRVISVPQQIPVFYGPALKLSATGNGVHPIALSDGRAAGAGWALRIREGYIHRLTPSLRAGGGLEGAQGLLPILGVEHEDPIPHDEGRSQAGAGGLAPQNPGLCGKFPGKRVPKGGVAVTVGAAPLRPIRPEGHRRCETEPYNENENKEAREAAKGDHQR